MPPNTSSLTPRIPHCCVEMLQRRRRCQRPGLNNHRLAVGLAGSSISHQASLVPGRHRASGGRAQRQQRCLEPEPPLAKQLWPRPRAPAASAPTEGWQNNHLSGTVDPLTRFISPTICSLAEAGEPCCRGMRRCRRGSTQQMMGHQSPDACSHRARSVRRSVEGQGHGRGTSASSVHQLHPWLHMQL